VNLFLETRFCIRFLSFSTSDRFKGFESFVALSARQLLTLASRRSGLAELAPLAATAHSARLSFGLGSQRPGLAELAPLAAAAPSARQSLACGSQRSRFAELAPLAVGGCCGACGAAALRIELLTFGG